MIILIIMEFTCFVWPLFHSFIDINATFYIDSLNDFIAIKKEPVHSQVEIKSKWMNEQSI